MKVPGLEGEYCPACASVLAEHLQNPKKVIVMCGSVCHATLQESGDLERLNNPHEKIPAPKEEKPMKDSEAPEVPGVPEKPKKTKQPDKKEKNPKAKKGKK